MAIAGTTGAVPHADDQHEHHGPPLANRSSRGHPQMLGMMLFIISEIMVFGAFFTAYFFIRVVNGDPWLGPGHRRSTLNRTKFVVTRAGSRRPGAGLGDAARAHDAGQLGEDLREPAGVLVVVGQPLDHPVAAVPQRDEPGRGDHARLAHPAADELPGAVGSAR